MRTSRFWLLGGGVLLVVAVVLVTSADADSPGWIAFVAEDDATNLSSLYLLTRTQIVGWAVAWLATLIVTGVLVRRSVVRRLTRRDDLPE